MGLGPKVFTRKNGNQKGGGLYRWSPAVDDKKTSSIKGGPSTLGSQTGCSCPAYSQGQDWVVGYVYKVVVVDGIQQRLCYVACGYVQ